MIVKQSPALKRDSKILKLLKKEPTGKKLLLCHTCGSCLSRCFLKEAVPEVNPKKFVRMVSNGWDELAAESRFLWTCTLCNRCTFDCPMGLKMDEVVRAARGVEFSRGKTPSVLKDGVESALKTGNVSMIPKDEFEETVEWLEEELQEELEDEEFHFPINEKGTKYLFLPNPREINVSPMQFMANAKMLHALGETWTVSSELSDVTNWGYFVGDPKATKKIALRVTEAVEALEAETLVLTECGHGFKVYARDLEGWINRKPKFKVVSIIELIAQGIKNKRLRFDPEKNPGRSTYHDPCNLARKGGIYEEPREVIKAVTEEFVEMLPNREEGWCCGGGGGIDRVPESTEIRMTAGKVKVDQIMKIEPQIVATGCLSCQSTLNELKKKYQFKADILSVVQLASRALVME